MTSRGFRFVPLKPTTPVGVPRLPLAAAWMEDVPDPVRDEMLATLNEHLETYDFAEYRHVVEAAAAIDPSIELLVLLGGDAGFRRGEAIALGGTDVDLRRRTTHIQRSSWNGHVTLPKGGRSRRLPLAERLAEALRGHRHLKGPRILHYDDGSPPTN